MIIEFHEYKGSLLLECYSRDYGGEWIDSILERKPFNVRRIFYFDKLYDKKDLFDEEELDDFNFLLKDKEESRVFELGVLSESNGYYYIDKNILDLKYDLLLHKSIPIDLTIFRAERDISIFRKLDKIIDEQIVVGGDDERAIPIEKFNEFLAKFPNSYELYKYADARIAQVLSEYFETMSPAEQKLTDYFKRKTVRTNNQITQNSLVLECEIQKFEYARQELEEMLQKPDNSYHETFWQKKIINLITLIFPKYIAAFSEIKVNDYYTNPAKPISRKIDILLVDFNGNIDLLELKKPFENKILSNKPNHRDNYIPHQELSTAIMQSEKYIFHLIKWGVAGEKALTDKLKDKLPQGLKIKINNPKAVILCGRSNQFNERQQLDFEIIKRKYANIADIMTYDDLLNRIDNIIEMLQKKPETHSGSLQT